MKLPLLASKVGLTASAFGLGATMSNFIGQLLVEKFGHVFSLTCSMWLSLVPIALFGLLMPETMGQRGSKTVHGHTHAKASKEFDEAASYKEIV